MSAWVSPPQLRTSHIVVTAPSIAQAASTALPPFWNMAAPAVAASGLPVIAIQCRPWSGGLAVRCARTGLPRVRIMVARTSSRRGAIATSGSGLLRGLGLRLRCRWRSRRLRPLPDLHTGRNQVLLGNLEPEPTHPFGVRHQAVPHRLDRQRLSRGEVASQEDPVRQLPVDVLV